ncbi:hypothetical protein E1B28_002784 [Marasmius oreades]|uniref:FAD dependent oxidoreductase domain-containing protein n=1 Tax=Marasmius oreades TaxID=181124 RepID=A0A9P7RPV3_9AGAR|nr:uncharacterized protein E1B28_002784 [Marasmius oreades]KAG7086863.1 hypothetical protein E1B28_002784 [Marasmius oreades]
MAQVPNTVDYIVVGGGTAGNVVAVRLAEQGNSVLVLEAGKDASTETEVRTPGLGMLNMRNPERNWNILSSPQKALNGRQISLPRSDNSFVQVHNLRSDSGSNTAGKSSEGVVV